MYVPDVYMYMVDHMIICSRTHLLGVLQELFHIVHREESVGLELADRFGDQLFLLGGGRCLLFFFFVLQLLVLRHGPFIIIAVHGVL